MWSIDRALSFTLSGSCCYVTMHLRSSPATAFFYVDGGNEVMRNKSSLWLKDSIASRDSYHDVSSKEAVHNPHFKQQPRNVRCYKNRSSTFCLISLNISRVVSRSVVFVSVIFHRSALGYCSNQSGVFSGSDMTITTS